MSWPVEWVRQRVKTFVKTLNHFFNIAKCFWRSSCNYPVQRSWHGLGAIQQTNIINVVAGSLVFHAWLGFFLWNTITFQQYFWVGFVTLTVTLEYKVIIYEELFCWINKSQRSGHKGLIFQLSAQVHLKQKKKEHLCDQGRKSKGKCACFALIVNFITSRRLISWKKKTFENIEQDFSASNAL